MTTATRTTALALAWLGGIALLSGAHGVDAQQIPAQPTAKTFTHPGIWFSQGQLNYIASQVASGTLPSTWPAAVSPSAVPYREAVATIQASIWGLPYNYASTSAVSTSETCYGSTTGSGAYTFPSTCKDVLNGQAFSDTFADSNTAISVAIPLVTNPAVVAPAGSGAVGSGGPQGYLFVEPSQAPIYNNPDYGNGMVFGNSMPVNVAPGQVVCGSGTRSFAGSNGAALDEIRMGCDEELNAAATAYSQALLYAVTGNSNYAINAIRVMDYYSGYIQNEPSGGAFGSLPPCKTTAVTNPTTTYPVPSNLPFPAAWPVKPALAAVAYAPGSGTVPLANCNVPYAGYVYTTYSTSSGTGSGVWNYASSTDNFDNLVEANKAFSNAPLQATWAAPQWMAAAELLEHATPSNGSQVSWPGFETFVDWLDIYYFTPYLSQDSFYDDHNGNWILTLLDTRLSYAVLTNNAALYYGTLAEWGEAVPAVLYSSQADSGWVDRQGNPAPFTYPEGPTDGSSSAATLGYGWNGQLTWGSAQNGFGQEICRDGAHAQYSLSAAASTAETAFIQGDPELYTSQANRVAAALEFQSGIQVAAITASGVENVLQSSGNAVKVASLGAATVPSGLSLPSYANDCAGSTATSAGAYVPILKGSMEKAHAEYEFRLGMALPNTDYYLPNKVRIVTDTFKWGTLVSPTKTGPNNQIAEDRMGVFWEAATNAAGTGFTGPTYSGPSLATLNGEAPTGLAATSTAPTRVSLTWAAPAGASVQKYNIYRDHVLIGTSGSPAYTDATVVGGVLYDYSVYAVDSSGNQSTDSNSVFVTTEATPSGSPSQIAVLEAPPSYESVSTPPSGSTATTLGTLYTLNITPSSDFPTGGSPAAPQISLSLSGGPSGISYVFCAPTIANATATLPAPCTPSSGSPEVAFGTAIPASLGVSILKVSVPASTPAGSYPLTVTATGAGATGSTVTGTTTLPLTIGSGGSSTPPPVTASVSLTPTGGSVTAGSSTSATVSTSGFTGSVSLSSSAPSGVTATVSGSTLTVTTAAATAAGTYTVSVTGTSGTQTATAQFTLTVTASTSPPPGTVFVIPDSYTVVRDSSFSGVGFTVSPAGTVLGFTPDCWISGGSAKSAVGTYPTECDGKSKTTAGVAVNYSQQGTFTVVAAQ